MNTIAQVSASQRPVPLCDETLSLVLPVTSGNSTVSLAPSPVEKVGSPVHVAGYYNIYMLHLQYYRFRLPGSGPSSLPSLLLSF